MRRNISIWVYIYTTAHLLFTLVIGIIAYIDPSYQFKGLLMTTTVSYPIALYANRNVAIAVAAAVGVIYGIKARRPFQLSAIMLIFLVTDISDLILMMSFNNAGPITALVYAIIFWIPEILSLIYLYSKFRPYRRRN